MMNAVPLLFTGNASKYDTQRTLRNKDLYFVVTNQSIILILTILRKVILG